MWDRLLNSGNTHRDSLPPAFLLYQHWPPPGCGELDPAILRIRFPTLPDTFRPVWILVWIPAGQFGIPGL